MASPNRNADQYKLSGDTGNRMMPKQTVVRAFLPLLNRLKKYHGSDSASARKIGVSADYIGCIRRESTLSNTKAKLILAGYNAIKDTPNDKIT